MINLAINSAIFKYNDYIVRIIYSIALFLPHTCDFCFKNDLKKHEWSWTAWLQLGSFHPFFFKMFGISQLNQTKNRKIRLVAIFVHICHIATFRPFSLGITNLHQTLIQRSGGSPRIHHLRGKVPKNSFWRTFLLPQKAISNRPSKTQQGANRHETPTRFTTTKRR